MGNLALILQEKDRQRAEGFVREVLVALKPSDHPNEVSKLHTVLHILQHANG